MTDMQLMMLFRGKFLLKIVRTSFLGLFKHTFWREGDANKVGFFSQTSLLIGLSGYIDLFSILDLIFGAAGESPMPHEFSSEFVVIETSGWWKVRFLKNVGQQWDSVFKQRCVDGF